MRYTTLATFVIATSCVATASAPDYSLMISNALDAQDRSIAPIVRAVLEDAAAQYPAIDDPSTAYLALTAVQSLELHDVMPAVRKVASIPIAMSDRNLETQRVAAEA